MQQALAQFKRYLQQKYPDRSTSKHYMNDLAIFSQSVGGRSPRTITARNVDDFVRSQSQQGLKAATINRRLSAISSFFEYLISVAEDDSWHNPVSWKRHSIRPGRHLPRDVSDDTARQLLTAIDHSRDRAIFTLMLGAGLRVGEIIKLQLGDLELASGAKLARLRVRGKGDKERVVWLTLEVWHQVQQWLQERPQTDRSDLFLNQHDQPLSVSGIQFRLKQYCQQEGLHLSCHQLRHTFARRLVEHAMPIDSLAKLLGHNNLQTTQRYIDGADPTVRTDFLGAMQQLNLFANSPKTHEPHFPGSLSPSPAEARPDPASLIEAHQHLMADCPLWLQEVISSYMSRRIARWQAHRVEAQFRFHFGTLCRVCRWLIAERNWSQLDQLKRTDLTAYVNARQAAGLQPRSIASELTVFRTFWRDLLDQELVTTGVLLQVKAPAAGEHLPRYLTGAEFQRLEQVVQTETQADQAQDRFNRAWFYLLAHAGLRLSETLNLRLSDCDLSGKRLRVRSGKGNRDRVIPLTPQLVTVLQDYLALRETVQTDHLLIYNGAPVKIDLLPYRLERLGQKAQIEQLTPHRLRHTLATLLINQGMPIVSLQKFLGHQNINNTLIYARIHDETVRQQFATAMAQIEGIAIADWPIEERTTVNEPIAISGC